MRFRILSSALHNFSIFISEDYAEYDSGLPWNIWVQSSKTKPPVQTQNEYSNLKAALWDDRCSCLLFRSEVSLERQQPCPLTHRWLSLPVRRAGIVEIWTVLLTFLFLSPYSWIFMLVPMAPSVWVLSKWKHELSWRIPHPAEWSLGLPIATAGTMEKGLPFIHQSWAVGPSPRTSGTRSFSSSPMETWVTHIISWSLSFLIYQMRLMWSHFRVPLRTTTVIFLHEHEIHPAGFRLFPEADLSTGEDGQWCRHWEWRETAEPPPAALLILGRPVHISTFPATLLPTLVENLMWTEGSPAPWKYKHCSCFNY